MLDKRKLAAAVAYNLEQPLSPAVWRRVQRAVGAVADGRPGPATARAVSSYQARHGLVIDGKAGPVTRRMLGVLGHRRSSPPTRGLWLDMSPGEVLGRRRAAFVRRLNALKINAVQLMLTSSKRTPSPIFKWSPDQWEELHGALSGSGIKAGLTVWPRPWEAYTVDLVAGLVRYFDTARPGRLEFDAEGNWKPGDVRGFESIEHAADALVSLARDLGPVELACTTIPEHFECSNRTQLSRRCSVLVPQAYSVYKPGKKKWKWGEKYGPGIMQRWALARASSVPGVKLACGLPLWAQKFPGRTTCQAMSAAWLAACDHPGVEEFWFWSAKHVLRHWKNANAARNFLISQQGLENVVS